MSLQNEINLWLFLDAKFIFFVSHVNFISSFIERFNAKGWLGVASLPPTHKFVAKFWLIAINTVFQVYLLKASWNWFMKSPYSFSDWTFIFSFSVNSCFSQVVAGLGWESKYVDTANAFYFSTYVVGAVAKRVHKNLKSICKHYRKCYQEVSARNHFWYI